MIAKQWDSVWQHGVIATCENGYGLINDGAIATKDGKIAWVGESHALPSSLHALTHEVHDLKGALLTPGFIDCHTHLVYAGTRAHEFEMRLQGVSYEEIAKQGGGILSTVHATRKASEEELLQQSLMRAKALMLTGVTTLEIKSGYGLDIATEIKILRVAKQIETYLPIKVHRTFLGAHVIAPEYRDKPDDYVDLLCHEMIPYIAKEKLAEAIDVFCEHIAFNLAQTEKLFIAAKNAGLHIHCHAEQLSSTGAAKLAAKYHALSADHLEHVTEEDVKALHASGTVAVLLPGAYYFLREKKAPPIDLFRKYQVPMAIASDCNPGTSPVLSLPIMLNMSSTFFKLTPVESLLGVTIRAAEALGIKASQGSLTTGKIANFAIWNANHPVELVYHIGSHLLTSLVTAGNISAFGANAQSA